MPPEYEGREQTWLKHRVLEEYLTAWAHKLGAIREVDLWYVDVFAGPWRARHVRLQDTSIAIGLTALNAAADTWARAGNKIRLHAAFVEKEASAYASLRAFTAAACGRVDVRTYHGPFASHVETIDRAVGPNPAFVFVDPTGWEGAGLSHVARLCGRERRDVLVNVMYDHINRFKDDERAFLRMQMREFFGLTGSDLPAGLDEHALMALYRDRLRERGNVPWVADLAVPVPQKERTQFRLVVAGHHPRVVDLFRSVEAKVIGREAASVRAEARLRSAERETGQTLLFRPVVRGEDSHYAALREGVEKDAEAAILSALRDRGSLRWGEIWPDILCAHHLTGTELRQLAVGMAARGDLRIEGRQPGGRTVKDEHVVSIAR